MRLISIIALLLVAAEPALACFVKKSLTSEQMEKADTVFEGRAVGVNVPKCTGLCSGKIIGPRSVVFEIEKIIKGKKLNGKIEVYWQNGTFGEADTVAAFRSLYGPRVRVGIIMHGTINKNIQCKMLPATRGDGKPTTVESCTTGLPLPFLPRANSTTDKPWIISDVCTDAFIVSLKE